MIDFYLGLSNPMQAFIAACCTFLITSFGAAIVFLFKTINKKTMDIMLSVSAGVMIAATFWSLLTPSIESAEELGMRSYIVVTVGIVCGGLLLILGDRVYNKIAIKNKIEKGSFKKVLMLVSSITLHNIPEGLAIGVAFGSIAYGLSGSTLMSALSLAIGIGIQNFPEGSAISLPLRREGYSRFKAFAIGALSGIVEPISALIGALLVIKVRILLPFLLSFAAGAMLYVIVEELIPESQQNHQKSLMSFSTLIGFCIMMVLDIAL